MGTLYLIGNRLEHNLAISLIRFSTEPATVFMSRNVIVNNNPISSTTKGGSGKIYLLSQTVKPGSGSVTITNLAPLFSWLILLM